MDDREKDRRFRAERRRQLRRSVLIQTDTFNEILYWLREARTRILAALAGAPSEFESWRLGQLQVEVRRSVETFERGATDVLTTGLDRAWAAGSDLIVRPLEAGGLEIGGRLPALDPRLLLAMKSFQTDRIRDIATTTVNRVNLEIGQAAIGVQSPFEAARKVAEHLEAPEPRARQIVRTELGTVYSEAGQQRMEQAVKLGVAGLQKQWRRSGKLHPRITHDLADGQIVDVDKPFRVGGIDIPKPRDPSIPVGERVNCGCSSLPHMRHWRVANPGTRPYTAEEIAANPTARQVEEVHAATPALDAIVSPARLAGLRASLRETAWGRELAASGSRLYGLNDEEALALHAYTFFREEAGARQVNVALRTGAAPPGSAEARLIALQTSALRKLPRVEGELYRRVRDLPPGLAEAAPGERWTEAGFFSTTRQAGRLDPHFAGMRNQLIVLRSHSGRDLAALSTFDQSEVIFAPGQRFRVAERDAFADSIMIWLDEDGDG